VFQAWFDDSGKEGIKGSPVYLLAGYSARVRTWEDFADDWLAELDRPPRLKYLHAREAYGWKGVDFDPYANSEWNAAHGPKNRKARDERLVKFAKLIVKHLQPGNDAYGLSWITTHQGYNDFIDHLSRVPTASIKDREELQRVKNPYYLGFQKILGQELKLRVAQGSARGIVEKTEILFDEGIDDWDNIEEAFKQFIRMLETREDPRFLHYLQNKENPDTRDDKRNPPLQASDLYAWHVRRIHWEVDRRGVTKYEDPVWVELRENGIKYYDFPYNTGDWDRILTNVRIGALSALGIWLPRRF
jgi:hypothetical protein